MSEASFRNIFEQLGPANADSLFRKARQASWIAKMCCGKSRRAAYSRKTRLLRRLAELGCVDVETDPNDAGLLLISRRGMGGLHARTSWFEAGGERDLS